MRGDTVSVVCDSYFPLLQRSLHMAALCCVLLSGSCLNGRGCVRNNRTELFLDTHLGPAILLDEELTLDCVAENNICLTASVNGVQHSVMLLFCVVSPASSRGRQ